MSIRESLGRWLLGEPPASAPEPPVSPEIRRAQIKTQLYGLFGGITIAEALDITLEVTLEMIAPRVTIEAVKNRDRIVSISDLMGQMRGSDFAYLVISAVREKFTGELTEVR